MMNSYLPPRENWRTALICALIFGAFALAGHWDEQDAEGEWIQSDIVEQTARDAEHQERIEHAAQAMCGPQAGAVWLDPTTVQCTPRRGIQKYHIAGVRP